MVTLEACVALLIFMTIMIFLLGLFQMSMAQGATAHAVMQASSSLSIDAYATEKLYKATWTDGLGSLIGKGIVKWGFGSAGENPYFLTEEKWYGGAKPSPDVLKMRFVGYLTGGDEAEAETFLKSVRVVDGLEGLDFSGSEVINGDLYYTLKYKLQFAFSVGDIGTINDKQTAVSRLWKN